MAVAIFSKMASGKPMTAPLLYTEANDFANWACSNKDASFDSLSEYGQQNLKYNGSDCSTQNGRYRLTKETSTAVKKAAAEVVRAWQACMNQKGSHASLKWGDDPHKFFVIIKHNFRHNNDNPTAKLSFNPGTGVTCNGRNADAFGDEIDLKNFAGVLLNCYRKDVDSTLNIGVELREGDAQAFILPALITAPPALSKAELISQGKPFSVHFSITIGTIQAGITHNGSYAQADNSWTVDGIKYCPNCQGAVLADPLNHRMQIWGADLTFDEAGNVYTLAGAKAGTFAMFP